MSPFHLWLISTVINGRARLPRWYEQIVPDESDVVQPRDIYGCPQTPPPEARALVSNLTASVQSHLNSQTVVRGQEKAAHMSDLIPKRKLAFGSFLLVSPLTSAECASRLTAMIQNPRSSLSGFAREKCFRVAWQYQPTAVFVRNSFKPYLFGKLQGFDGGTRVLCHFTLHPLVIGVLICVACMGAAGVVMLHNWTLILVPLVILLAGLGLSWGERELLVYDVTSAINARLEVDDRMARQQRHER
jgi:hypothetical protein